MKIQSLAIDNFRGISTIKAEKLGDTIIVAGQNGSGKSCIFDAIRLLKSVYGGYQQNEWQNFFTEFQIQLHGGPKHLSGLFNDISKDVIIECVFELRDNEKAFLTANAEELLEETIWQSVLPEAFQYGGYRKALFAAQFRDRQPEVTKRVRAGLPNLNAELAQSSLLAKTTIRPSGEVALVDSILLNVIFTTYRPRDIGVIDFHGAQRHYGRENVQGINLSLDAADQAKSASSLYNYNAKYNNVKSEMAGNFIKQLLAEKADENAVEDDTASLTDAMKELFASFFPDKKFIGPRPNKEGFLDFPVKTQSGHEHDLDELSSGEKEILYGYLRIRSSAPRDSIILLDEPELHLNPRLIRGLPEFYRKHLGEALQNQLWLVTHSDALIREAIGKPGFNVFHMLPCGADGASVSQMRPLIATKNLDLVMADLVGDLAAYRPGGKGVIFEGGGDSDFDKSLTTSLFSEEVRGINLISGSNKAKVRALHEVLARAHEKGDLPTKFYAVTDADSERADSAQLVTHYVWDVYHIENYLLEPDFIASAVNSFRLSEPKITAAEVETSLARSARSVVPEILVRKMRSYANSEFIQCINLGFAPDTMTISSDLHGALNRSKQRIDVALGGKLTAPALLLKEGEFRADIEKSFADGSWMKQLPGRDILRHFVTNERVPTNYEAFRNQIVSAMATAGHKPNGMKIVIEKIKGD